MEGKEVTDYEQSDISVIFLGPLIDVTNTVMTKVLNIINI